MGKASALDRLAGTRTLPGAATLQCALLLWAVFSSLSSQAVEIDGKLEPDEWRNAKTISEFRSVVPLTGDPASLSTEGWILATPQGLAVAFRNHHPASVPRTEQRVQRDFEDAVDRVNVMVDFDGDGRVGHAFTLSSTGGICDAIVSSERDFNADWDGNWRHAVLSDTSGWTAEILIPWHIAPMRAVAGKTRTLKIYLDRVVVAQGERSAWPLASSERARFLSDFAPVDVDNYSQSLLAITPYVSSLYDNVNHAGDSNAGFDLLWKPTGQLQLAATVNPDFGQVESDDLVVNFDATETFIGEKRPFFTENQGIFEFTTPSDFSQLLYTRRVGAGADDGSGPGDISAAVKLNGSLGGAKYGVLAAQEPDDAGRTFGALRLVRDLARQNLGFMLTQVERPFLNRTATVVGIDHDWRPTARWNVRTRLIGSDIARAQSSTRDTGATVWADYEMDNGWRQQWIAMHFGNRLDINDAGFLSRNSTNYLHWQINRRFTDAGSRYASKDWRWRATTNYNDHGELLNRQFRVSREGRLRDGSYEYGQININSAGVDDLLTRGNGNVKLPWSFNSYFNYERPRQGNWSYALESEMFRRGLRGDRGIGYSVSLQPTYFVSDAFNVYAGLHAGRSPSRLIWQRENLIGSFDARELNVDAGFSWIITSRQDVRFKLQAISIDARASRGYRVDPTGTAIASSESIDDFGVSNLGIQLRYRFELAPLSYLYVVYGRGGFRQDPREESAEQLLRDSFSLRDEEQLFVKFSYRLER